MMFERLFTRVRSRVIIGRQIYVIVSFDVTESLRAGPTWWRLCPGTCGIHWRRAGAPPFNSLGRRFLLSKSQRNCRDGVDDHDPPHSAVRHTLWRIEADVERPGDSEH